MCYAGLDSLRICVIIILPPLVIQRITVLIEHDLENNSPHRMYQNSAKSTKLVETPVPRALNQDRFILSTEIITNFKVFSVLQIFNFISIDEIHVLDEIHVFEGYM